MVREGEIVDDVFRLVLAQIRSKRETAGDFRAQFAATNTGVRRLTALFETLRAGDGELLHGRAHRPTPDRRTRAELASLPEGEYVAEGYVDNDGFTDPAGAGWWCGSRSTTTASCSTSPAPTRSAGRPVNSTYAQTYSAAAYSLKCIADPDCR